MNRWFVALLCRAQWREIRRSLMENGAELMHSGKSHSDKFYLFTRNNSSTLFKQNTNSSTHRFSTTIQWQNVSQKNRLKKPTFLLRRKEKIFFFFRTFLSKKKAIERSFHFNSLRAMKKWKNCWRKTVESILQIRCSWKINESKMKIEFSFRNLRHWNFFSSSSTIDFRQKIFKSKIKWKDFLQFAFSKFTPRTIKWTMFESKRFGRKSFFPLLFIEFIKNSTNLQLIKVLSPVNFSSNPTIKLRLKRDDWLFCLFTLPRPLSYLWDEQKPHFHRQNSLNRIGFVSQIVPQKNFFIWRRKNNAEISSDHLFFRDQRTTQQIFLFVRVTKKQKDKLTKTNTIKFSICFLFSIIHLKIIERRLWKVNFISKEIGFRHDPTIRFSFICSTSSDKFILFQKQNNSIQTQNLDKKLLSNCTFYLKISSIQIVEKSNLLLSGAKTRRVERTVHRSSRSFTSIHFAKFLTSIQIRLAHCSRCTIDILHHFLRCSTLNSP